MINLCLPRRPVVSTLAVFGALLLVGGCSSSGGTTSAAGTSTGGSSSTAGTTPATPASSSDSGGKVTALSICELATPAEIGAAVGGVVTVDTEQSTKILCTYNTEERYTLTPTIDDATDRGYDEAKLGASQLLKTVADVPGVGEKAFVATGKGTGALADYGTAMGGVVAHGHTVTVTLTSTRKSVAELGTAVEKILTAIGGRL
jgi:hypothetical protein